MLDKNQKKNIGIIGLVIIGLILFQTFVGESRAEELDKWEITSFTELGGLSFDPGESVDIEVTVKNLQSSTDTIKLEAVIFSDTLAESMSLASRMAGLVQSTPNCYESETFVDTVTLEDVGPSESITATLTVIMPDEDTLTQDDQSNWGDSFVQVVGLYEECGEYETYVKDTFVLIGKESTGETCEEKSDCSGWLWKGLECVQGQCVDNTVVDDEFTGGFEFTSLKDFYEDNKLAFKVTLGLFAFLFIMWIYRTPKPPKMMMVR